MAGTITQTVGDRELVPFASEPTAMVIRWVFPFPVRPPTWLEGASLTFGRDEACEVRLEGGNVSRRHASIRRSGSLWLLDDLHSKNGLFVNARRSPGAALEPGDIIRIGNFVGVVMQVPRSADLSFADLGCDIHGGFLHRVAVARTRAVASSPISVLLQGATGTGKERFARALHVWSGRTGAFFAVNCATYSNAVAAAELFGYRKGAFTGADQASGGHIRAADHGTFMLDELVDLPSDVQAMLLRVLENREVLALGETRHQPIDVRFVGACQIALSEATSRGDFRPDLRARLEGQVIELPPLRACAEIVPELFSLMFQRHAGHPPRLSAAAVERLCLHDWPMNVRELEMLARQLATTCDRAEQLATALLERLEGNAEPPAPVQRGKTRKGVPATGRLEPAYSETDLRALLSELTQCNGNVTKAAAALGLSRPKAYRMLDAATRARMADSSGIR